VNFSGLTVANAFTGNNMPTGFFGGGCCSPSTGNYLS
jgi:hypothetical protein